MCRFFCSILGGWRERMAVISRSLAAFELNDEEERTAKRNYSSRREQARQLPHQQIVRSLQKRMMDQFCAEPEGPL